MKILIIFSLFKCPMQEKVDQLMLTANEIFFFMILFMYLVVDIINSSHEGGSASPKFMYNTVGTVTIVLFIGLMAFNIITALFAVVVDIKEKCSKKKGENDSKSGLAEVFKKRERQM